MKLVPGFPTEIALEEWDALTLVAATVFLEAEGEPTLGKQAVAFVVRNRMDDRHQRAQEVCLAPFQFSCFNEDARAHSIRRLAAGSGAAISEDCWYAACAALWRFILDPTHGSVFYLNPDVTRKIRPTHDLPSWYDARRVKLRVGNHEFLIA